jgi:hypothetical protein
MEGSNFFGYLVWTFKIMSSEVGWVVTTTDMKPPPHSDTEMCVLMLRVSSVSWLRFAKSSRGKNWELPHRIRAQKLSSCVWQQNSAHQPKGGKKRKGRRIHLNIVDDVTARNQHYHKIDVVSSDHRPPKYADRRPHKINRPS